MDLSDKTELSWLAVVIRDLRGAAPEADPMLVGAMARDLLLEYAHGVAIMRATHDVDLAFALADWTEFKSLREALLASGVFSPGRLADHRVLHQDATPIDLIPFGGIERADRSIVWPDDDGVLSVLGYREARETAVEFTLPLGQRISTVSLPILAVLKLIAWSERHVLAPRKDANDLFLILQNYLKGENADRIYEDAAHLLEADDFDYDMAGAWLAGHDAAGCLVQNSSEPDRVITRVESILSTEADPDGPLSLVGETGLGVDRSLQLLNAFREGFGSQAD
jgi:predicted nucleotidyltransferase